MFGSSTLSEKSSKAALALLKRQARLALVVFTTGIYTTTAAAVVAPDLIVLGSRIETVESAPAGAKPVEAFAVTAGKFSYVGSAAEALRMAGPKTRVERLGERRILPGLVDTHVHATRTFELNTCDLHNEGHSLAQIAGVVRECLTRFRKQPGEWLRVAQWAVYSGNEPDAQHPTLRAALDVAEGHCLGCADVTHDTAELFANQHSEQLLPLDFYRTTIRTRFREVLFHS